MRLDVSVVDWEEEEEGEDSLRMGLDTLVVGGGFSRSVQPVATAGESVFLTFTWWSELQNTIGGRFLLKSSVDLVTSSEGCRRLVAN